MTRNPGPSSQTRTNVEILTSENFDDFLLSSDGEAALSASLAALDMRTKGNRVNKTVGMYLDSRNALGLYTTGASRYLTDLNYIAIAQARAGVDLDILYNRAVGGTTLHGFVTNGMLSAAIADACDVAILTSPINDIDGSGDLAATLAQIAVDAETVCAAFYAAGIYVLWGGNTGFGTTAHPQSGHPNIPLGVTACDRIFYNLFKTKPWYGEFIPMMASTADADTGKWAVDTYSNDGEHQSNLGAYHMADPWVAPFIRLFNPLPFETIHLGNFISAPTSRQLFRNPVGKNTGGYLVPSGPTANLLGNTVIQLVGATAVHSVVAGKVRGHAQKSVITSTANNDQYIFKIDNSTISGYSVGDILEASLHIEIETPTALKSIQVNIDNGSATYSGYGQVMDATTQSLPAMVLSVKLPLHTVVAGALNLAVTLTFSGAGGCDFYGESININRL